MDELDRPFLPGNGVTFPFPLARYLPLLPPGTIDQWAADGPAVGSWLLDPFGAHPLLALEAARAGYRVLVASNNPILGFVLEVLTTAPKQQDFEAVIAALAASQRGNERLEQYIRSLYQTICAACGKSIQAQAFIWQRDQTVPGAKIYSCPQCGDDGERQITSQDIERLKQVGSDGLTRSRALARVAAEKGSDQAEVVEEALKTYLPRPLYILTTMINKAEGLGLSPQRKRLLTALLISACDDANTLWQYPAARSRPRQLTIPPQFRENNLWLALENAITIWTSQPTPVAMTHWPQQPPAEGGICLYQGRIRALMPLPDNIRPAALLSVVPRPNQAFWTLCAIWCGWLWGREAVQPLRGALERRRYDWYWMTRALDTTLKALNQHLPEQTPLFTIATEMTPGFLLSLFCAPQTASVTLEGIAYQPEADIAQFWQRSTRARRKPTGDNPKTAIHQALLSHLHQTGEPASYTLLFAAALRELAARSLLPSRVEAINNDFLGRIQATLGEVLDDQVVFQRIGGRSQAEESSFWYLAEPPGDILPLADRVEKVIGALLVKDKEIKSETVVKAVYEGFKGLQAPPARLIRACLESYARPDLDRPGVWVLREEDDPTDRRTDLNTAIHHLKTTASRLGFTATGDEPLVWANHAGQPVYLFYVTAACIFSRFVYQPQSLPIERCVIVYPGGRAGLLGTKMERDPRLKGGIEKGWHLLKYRQLREIAERPELDPRLWEELLEGDPPSWESMTQMSMF